MRKIINKLPQFINDLQGVIADKKAIICNEKGEWKVIGSHTRVVSQIFPKQDSILQAFHTVLAQAEAKDLFFNASDRIMQDQKKFYNDIVTAGRKVVQLHKDSKSTETKKLCDSLELSIIKLQYRIQSENGGFKTSDTVDQALVKELTGRVEKWKNKDEKYQKTRERNFTAQIEKICRYPEIVRFLLRNEQQCNDYLKLSLRDNFNIEVINQYHYESINLANNFIACRVGAIARKILTVDMTPIRSSIATVKTLNLLMENKKINLLNKAQKVRFSNNLDWNIARIYKDFKEKGNNPGDLEIMWDGVVPFNGHNLGARIIEERTWSPFSRKIEEKYNLDITKSRCFEKTPVLDKRSKAYIEEHYGITIQNTEQAVVVLEASRRDELDLDNAHGYTLIYQYSNKDESGNDIYRVYAFGAFPLKFPQNKLELANFIGDTVPGTVAFDPNYFYSQRQKASWPQVVDKKVADALLEELRKQKEAGIVFQFGWENCAYFIRNVFVKVFKEMNLKVEVPEFFEEEFVKTKPTNEFLKKIQVRFKVTHKILMPLWKWVLVIFFGAMRSKFGKSLLNTPFFKGDQPKINLPSKMHYDIKNGNIITGCVLNYGNSPDPVGTASAA